MPYLSKSFYILIGNYDQIIDIHREISIFIEIVGDDIVANGSGGFVLYLGVFLSPPIQILAARPVGIDEDQ